MCPGQFCSGWTINRTIFNWRVVFIHPPKSQKCLREYCARDTPTGSTHLLLQKAMEKPLLMIPAYQDYRIQPKEKKYGTMKNHSSTRRTHKSMHLCPRTFRTDLSFILLSPSTSHTKPTTCCPLSGGSRTYEHSKQFLTSSLMESMTGNTKALPT